MIDIMTKATVLIRFRGKDAKVYMVGETHDFDVQRAKALAQRGLVELIDPIAETEEPNTETENEEQKAEAENPSEEQPTDENANNESEHADEEGDSQNGEQVADAAVENPSEEQPTDAPKGRRGRPSTKA